MPTYEYVCKSCGHLFEIVQSMRDDPLTECPECGGELRKVFAPPSISFRGSGSYATDHGKKAAKPSGDKGDKGERGDKGEKKAPSGTDAGTKGGGDSSASSTASEGASTTSTSTASKDGNGT